MQDTQQFTQLLDALAQPVFVAEGGIVTRCNRAAEALQITVGMHVTDMAEGGVYDPAQRTPMNLPLRLPSGAVADASVYPLEDKQVFVLPATAAQTPQMDTVFYAAQSLRVPLSNLFGASGTLFPRLEELEDPAVQRSLSSLNRAFYQLLRVTCNLTDLHTALRGEMKLRREKTELTNFVYDLFMRTEPLCKTRGITLTCKLPPATFSGWIDRQKLERALLNVLGNAIKFTPQGGTIEMQLARVGESAVIRIQDSGEGFDPATISTVFSRYARALELGDPRWGVGAGLPLARSIAQLHGGNVVVQSERGAGACVSLSVSLKAPEAAELKLCSPVAAADYTGGYSHELTEFADVLPLEVYDTINVN